ncbi:MAG: hypothetical protein LBF17_01950 [Mediterranea sp.]|jgi:hypothetical protein|nr:hypothetical protein [Mediterranea sp.]
MNLSKILAFSTFILLVSVYAKAQFVDYGADPSYYKWNIVRAEHYNLIYPQGNDSMAYRYISLLETVYPYIERTIGKPFKKKHPVILHPGNMLSNGMVSWAPRRMEIISTPSSDLHAQAYDRHLVTHESRHIMQTGKLMSGIFRPFYFLLGEQAQGIASLFAPNWFFEGDAVSTETALSRSGRGRLPEFHMIYRAHRIDNLFYTFDKWNLGSFKDYTGTYYALGYNLTAYARHQFGEDVWNKVTTRYTRRIAIPPFGRSIKKVTGISSQQLFDQTFAFLEKEWKEQESVWRRSGSKPAYLSPADKRYNAYKYPQALNDSVVLAVRSNFKDLTALVMIEKGKEKRLAYLGNINSRIVLNNNNVYWTEYVSGLRWTHRNYSVLKSYDLNTKQISTVTPRQRYQSPTIDPDGKRAAVSEFSVSGENHIVLVDTQTGKVHARHKVPNNAFAKELAYTGNGDIIATTVDDDGLRLLQLHTQSGEWSELLAATSANITSPVWQNGKLIFESGLNGTNNIYEYDPAGAAYNRLTTARFGAFTPSVSADGKKLLFADYQANGYHLASLSLDSLKKEPADFADPHRFELAETLAGQEQFNPDTMEIRPVEFNPKRYYKAPHLFKIHSWAPFYYDVTKAVNLQTDDFSTIVKPGATLISQNSLNTAIAQVSWYYKEKYHHGKLAMSYTGWFPVIDLAVDYGDKAINIEWKETEKGRAVQGIRTDRTFLEAEAHVYLPFNLTRNHYVRGIRPSATYFFTNNKYEQYDSGKLRNFQYLLSELHFYNYRKMAKRDILPRWGYQMRLQHLFSPSNSENYGHIYAARLTGYVPGLVRGDGLMARLTYQYQDLDNKYLYLPKQVVNAPRGYDYLYATRQLMGVQADYSFKLFNPDFSIGSLLYIQRIRSNIFYDYFRNEANESDPWTTQSSFGSDLILDCNILQANFPITLGARIVKPIDYGELKVEALFTISF